MIETCKSFKTSDSRTFLNREEAQRHELAILLGVSNDDENNQVSKITFSAIDTIINKRDEVLAILGTRKPRVAKPKQAKKAAKLSEAA